jgi:hypothetical protein
MLPMHESSCAHPRKSGLEIMEPLRIIDDLREREVKPFRQILDLMSYEKLSFHDLQLRPYRTDDFIPKLFYESNKFNALAFQWTVKGRVNDSQENPLHTMRRSISYQLVCKSKPTSILPLMYTVLRGPFGDAQLLPTIYEFDFGPEVLESSYRELPLPDSVDCNRLLSAKTINMRLVLAQVTK